MKMRIVFHHLPKSLDQDFLKRAVRAVLKKEKKTDSKIEIIFLSRHQIEKLNFNYRKKKEPTDVLSFDRLSFDRANQFPLEDKNYLGELVVCLPYVKKNAKKFKESLKKELARVLIHGILHLLGYNHEKGGKDFKTMMAKQEKYLLSLVGNPKVFRG